MDGWIKLYRQLVTNGWLKNHKIFIFWTYCLLKATHKSMKSIVGFQEVNLDPGQFIFGRRIASEETGLSEREIRTGIDALKKAGNLTSKTTNKFSIISIVNWETYQGKETENDQQNDQQPTSNRPHTRTKEQKNKYSCAYFEHFYKTYPKRKGRKDSERAWQKLNPDESLFMVIMAALEKQKSCPDWKKDGGQFIPLPATWINGRRWEDEVQEVKGSW